jgi:hypothetical protein
VSSGDKARRATRERDWDRHCGQFDEDIWLEGEGRWHCLDPCAVIMQMCMERGLVYRMEA